MTWSELTKKVSALDPLVPIAQTLKALPAKVSSLQASVSEGAQQVQALNLIVNHLEKNRPDTQATEDDMRSPDGHIEVAKADGILG